MSTVATAITIAELVKLGFMICNMWGQASGMSEEELEKLHKEVRAEFAKSDPAALLAKLKGQITT